MEWGHFSTNPISENVDHQNKLDYQKQKKGLSGLSVPQFGEAHVKPEDQFSSPKLSTYEELTNERNPVVARKLRLNNQIVF